MQAMRKRTGKIFKNTYPYEIYDTDATKTHIDSVLQQIIKKSKPTDTFVFYYAGHGVLSTAEGGMSGDYHLVLHDIMRIYEYEDVLNEKGISSKELKEYCKNIKAQKQLLVLDACQSGSAVKEFAMRGSIEEKAIRQLATNTGSTILASALEDQTAKEYRKLGHGLFTYALLKGLEGEADNGDGKITVFELSAYLDDKVTELTTEFGKPQATIGNRAGQDFPIVIVK